MSDDARETLKARQARLLEEAAAIARYVSELDRIAAKYDGDIRADKQDAPSPPPPREDAGVSVPITIAMLVDRYRSDPASPYPKLRFHTRQHYDSLIKRILEDCANDRLSDLKARNIQAHYDGWVAGGKTASAHAIVTMLRGLINYGAAVLEDSQCERLSTVLHNLHFEMPKSKKVERINVEQATAIRAEANKSGAASIALAQAIQYELGVRQRDVIGEWIPESEPGDSDTFDRKGMKWVRGIRWEEIKDLSLRHPTSRSGQTVVRSLSKAPMVKEQFGLQFPGSVVAGNINRGALPASGPIIVSEATGLPYVAWEFRRMWRLLARRAGVPDGVKNMDNHPKAKRSAETSDMNGHAEKGTGGWKNEWDIPDAAKAQ